MIGRNAPVDRCGGDLFLTPSRLGRGDGSAFFGNGVGDGGCGGCRVLVHGDLFAAVAADNSSWEIIIM